MDSLVKREEEAAAKTFESRWNFNIRSETPQPGRYEWEKIKSNKSTPSGSVSHLPSSGNVLSEKTVVANKKSATCKEVSASQKETQSSGDSDCIDSKLSPPQEKDVNDNTVVGAIKRKTARVEEGDPKVAKSCEPP